MCHKVAKVQAEREEWGMNWSLCISPLVLPTLTVNMEPKTWTLPLAHTCTWSVTNYYGSDQAWTCGTQPPPTPTLLRLFLWLPSAQTAIRASKWVSLPLGSFLSNLTLQNLQNSKYNIPLRETFSWCPKFSQLGVYIRITWVLFSKFTFLSSTFNLMK